MQPIRYFSASVMLLAAFFLVQISPVSGRPYQGEEETFVQPDGSSLPLYLYGDEFFIRAQTRDGYTVVRDKKNGWICYAKLSDQNDSLISSGIPVIQSKDAPAGFDLIKKGIRLPDKALRNRMEMSRVKLFSGRTPGYITRFNALAKSTISATDSIPSKKNLAEFTGVCKGLCVVWDFSDAPITANFPSADSAIRFLNKKFNSLDPKDNSLRYYFQTWSGGKFDLQFIVKGVCRAPKTFAYYDSLPFCEGHSELIVSACKTLNAEGFDFTQFTRKSKSTSIRGLCIVNTGKPSTWSDGMWNHSGDLYSNFSSNGVTLGSYCTSTTTGDALPHEMGHLIADWPDLYSANDAETGCWDIMGSSGSALIPNPYFLYMNGWNDVVNIGNLSAGSLITVNGKNLNVGHIYYRNAKPDEFFYFKPYTRQMPLCSKLYDQGLTIWHINKKGDNFYYPSKPLLVEMVHANNTNSNIMTNVCFRAGGSNAYSSTTTPAANWIDKTPSGIDIKEISTADTVMTFKLGGTVGNQSVSLRKSDKPVCRLVEMNGRSILLFSRDTRTSACRLVICTASGKSVFEKDLTSEDNVSDLSFLPAGMYVAYLRGPVIHENEKIVIGR